MATALNKLQLPQPILSLDPDNPLTEVSLPPFHLSPTKAAGRRKTPVHTRRDAAGSLPNQLFQRVAERTHKAFAKALPFMP